MSMVRRGAVGGGGPQRSRYAEEVVAEDRRAIWLCVSLSSWRAPRRTALGTVWAAASPIAPNVSRRDARPATRELVAEELGDERREGHEHRERDEPVHRTRRRRDAGVVPAIDARTASGSSAASSPDLHVEHEVEPEDGEQKAGSGAGEGARPISLWQSWC